MPLDVLLCRNNSVAMGASFAAPEYSLKVADVSKIRTLNAIARNTLWSGGDVEADSHNDDSVKQIPQNWSRVILLIFPRRHFGGRVFFTLLLIKAVRAELRVSILELSSVLNTDSERFFFISQYYRTCWSVPSEVIFIVKDLANVAPTCTVTHNVRNIVAWFILLWATSKVNKNT